MIWSEEALRAMSEDELCRQVLIPLFSAMGYQDVDYHHGGALEQGKDFVMWKEETIKGRVNYAVVVKAKRITGAAAKGLHEVLAQIKQCLGSSYIDKKTLEPQPVHQCLLVSSHEIKKEGVNSLHSLLVHERLIGRVFTVDGEELWRLLSKHLPQHTVHSQLESAYQALGSPHPDYDFRVTLSPGERLFTLVPKHPEASPIPLPLSPMFPNTPEGERKRHEFNKHIETGAPVELDQENVQFESLPEPLRLLFPFVEGQPYTIRLGPVSAARPLIALLTAESTDGASLALPTIEFTSIQAGLDVMTLSNEDQPTPLKIKIVVSRLGKKLNFTYNYMFGGQSVYWLVQAIQLHDMLKSGGRLSIRDLGTGISLFSFRIVPGEFKAWDEEFSSIAKEILEIQDALKITIKIPERSYFVDNDILEARILKTIIEEGKATAGVVTINFKGDRKAAEELLYLFSRQPGPEFTFERSQHFETLLDESIPLGPVQAQIKNACLHPHDLEKLRSYASGRRQKEISLRLLPSEGEQIVVQFRDWPREDKDLSPTDRHKNRKSRRSHQPEGP